MFDISTFPSLEVLDDMAQDVPSYMGPNTKPYAVFIEGALSEEECELIIYVMMTVPPYEFQHCAAQTRECPNHEVLEPIEVFGRNVNALFFGYDLYSETKSWLQTYETGEDYVLHMDAAPGQTRKMTAVALLSDPEAYSGGDLELFFEPTSVKVPRTRGTIAVFPSWMLHKVHPVTGGLRQTINLGFWGPPFR